MRKLLIAIVAIFAIGSFSASAQKMGHIDYMKVVDSLDTYKKAMAKQKEVEATATESATYLEKLIREKYAYYQANEKTMTSLERDIKMEELNMLQGRLQEVEQVYLSQMEIINERYMVPIQEWLKEAVATVGKARGMDYIMYYQEEGGTFWVNPGRGVDLTNDVIAEMRRLELANPVLTPGE